MKHNISCELNMIVGGDHAYCECECHAPTLPAVPPSRKRRNPTTLAVDLASSTGDRTVEIIVENNRIVDEREIPPSH